MIGGPERRDKDANGAGGVQERTLTTEQTLSSSLSDPFRERNAVGACKCRTFVEGRATPRPAVAASHQRATRAGHGPRRVNARNQLG